MAKCIVIGEDKSNADSYIVFIYALTTGTTVIGDIDHGCEVMKTYTNPNTFEYIELITKRYTDGENGSPMYDMMFAHNGTREHGTLFLGYWNDGVV